jgi:hypothetical protein
MRIGHVIYWALTGTALGMSLAALPSIGLFLLPIGLALLVLGAFRFWGRAAWAALFGFGALPAALITNTIVTAPPPCSTASLTSHGSSVSCSGPIPEVYYVMVAGFTLIALVGVVGFVWAASRRRRPAIQNSPTAG